MGKSGKGAVQGAVQGAVLCRVLCREVVWLERGCCSQFGGVSGKGAVQGALPVAVQGAVRLLLTVQWRSLAKRWCEWGGAVQVVWVV